MWRGLWRTHKSVHMRKKNQLNWLSSWENSTSAHYRIDQQPSYSPFPLLSPGFLTLKDHELRVGRRNQTTTPSQWWLLTRSRLELGKISNLNQVWSADYWMNNTLLLNWDSFLWFKMTIGIFIMWKWPKSLCPVSLYSGLREEQWITLNKHQGTEYSSSPACLTRVI